MKNDDGALSFGTSVDLRGLETGISQIEAKIATMEGKLGAKIDGIGKAVSRSGITAKSTLEDVTNAGNVLDGTLGNVAKTAASIGMAFTAQSLIRQIINIRGEFQQLEVAFETMLGSEEKAVQLMDQLVDTAAKTPFDLQGIADGARRLLAYGENVENINDDLIRLGNIAAGLSQPRRHRISLWNDHDAGAALHARPQSVYRQRYSHDSRTRADSRRRRK